MHTHHYNLTIRALVYKEDGDYVAHGLEVDLVGYGKTDQEAAADLHEMLLVQISYASQSNRPELVWNPAPKEFFERWDKAVQCALSGAVSDDVPGKMQTKATFVMLTPQEIQSAKKKPFVRDSKPSLAKAS